ncbi:MAG: HAD family hydrolase [Anaerolineaceae bacterium]|nr:HAD family hydrolase [Anaerolineaceae bacterium]
MNREEALEIVKTYVKNENLIHHMFCVEAAMRFYAKKLNQDEEDWGLVGLLHDFDWEIHPTMEEHPIVGAEILRSKNVPEHWIRAILSHSDYTGVKRESLMEKALYACDEITGLVTAVALVRPSKSIYDLTPKSVKKKWNNKNFAAGANREEILQAVEEFNIDLWEHTQNIILAMRSIAPLINLEGNLSAPENE